MSLTFQTSHDSLISAFKALLEPYMAAPRAPEAYCFIRRVWGGSVAGVGPLSPPDKEREIQDIKLLFLYNMYTPDT